jgi:hypothetical protein
MLLGLHYNTEYRCYYKAAFQHRMQMLLWDCIPTDWRCYYWTAYQQTKYVIMGLHPTQSADGIMEMHTNRLKILWDCIPTDWRYYGTAYQQTADVMGLHTNRLKILWDCIQTDWRYYGTAYQQTADVMGLHFKSQFNLQMLSMSRCALSLRLEETASRYGGQLQIYCTNSRGQPTKVVLQLCVWASG